MDKNEEQPKKIVASYANKLPPEIVGRFLQNLSVGDRLKSERVSPLWEKALSKWGWTEQRKLNEGIVFERANNEQIDWEKFWENLDDGSCQLVSIINLCAPWLRELNLTFIFEDIEPFLQQVAKSIHSLKKLEKLDIYVFDLEDFVDHLPNTLRELKSSCCISLETLQTLSIRCPNLEEVPFRNIRSDLIKNEFEIGLETETVIELIGQFPRQKKLGFSDWFIFRSEKIGALASIGQLKDLVTVKLSLLNCECFDGKSLEAIIRGCQRLRSLSFDSRKLTEGELFNLAKIPNLTVLAVNSSEGEFTDAVLMAIAQRGQLKKLWVSRSDVLTDNSIVYLLDQCKSLVSLCLYKCSQITKRSLEAVVAEVDRRHGSQWPPQTRPSGPLDPGIFYFNGPFSRKEKFYHRAKYMIFEKPWLRFESDFREII